MATGVLSSVKNGQIHISLEKLKNYTELSYARIIIHEAAHRYLGAKDHAYAHEAAYSATPMLHCIDNADSLAWAAISLYCGSVKMAAPANKVSDWAVCT